MPRDPTPQTVYLKDYTPPAFVVLTAELDVSLHDEHARVRARLTIARNPASTDRAAPLALDGDELELTAIALDGRDLGEDDYRIEGERLTVAGVPDEFQLQTEVLIHPERNTKLMGLYASRDGYFTQCEPEGFRRITYFIDRPDVMARYTVTIHADRARFPQLLANGNLLASGDEPGGRHWATWEDPFPKPSYLFAMVAAKLDKLEDAFVTRSGKRAKLQIYVEPGKLDQAAFAMQALMKAMKWDEEVFGLELDLDQYMIVAVGDFNMGAMENKGLNIFNTKYVLARPDVATDLDFQNIDRVVAHEYFHNWTGNRVTCRDWFQLSLKEGLTVFRDQEFGADMYSRPVQRIREVRNLRAAQYPEDAGPMAHPVRPHSYMEISNFYTATVYEKGAEVVRMIHTLIGPKKFRLGMDLYFQRHDGRAVTTDDFVEAMADAGGADLAQFGRWYDQAGTPVLEVSDAYNPTTRRYIVRVRQSCPPTPGQPDKLPFHIPLRVGLVSPEGHDLPLQLEGEAAPQGTTRVLSVTEAEQTFTFLNLPAKPVPSLLRDFSAPIHLRYPYSSRDLVHLMAHDSDPFTRWEAGQRLAADLILKGVAAIRDDEPFVVPEAFVGAVARLLADSHADPAFAAEALALPAEGFIAEMMQVADPDAIHAARRALARQLAQSLREEFLSAYRTMEVTGEYSPDAASAGRRALRNTALHYLAELDDETSRRLAATQLEAATNMTDAMAALHCLANSEGPERVHALEAFYERWKDEPLVVDKWLRVQATSRLPGTLDEVKRLTRHHAFSLRNPNKIYSLIGGFAIGNPVRFHAADGAGYAFLADQVIALQKLNPQVAARMARAFDRWRKFDPVRQAHARAALGRIRDVEGLAKDVAEVVGKALG
ncbi:MAG TPA: aminopeptidase N [Pelomicrobium sp.]|nr:aminopeptidase N [Pelomicrobium sp.]